MYTYQIAVLFWVSVTLMFGGLAVVAALVDLVAHNVRQYLAHDVSSDFVRGTNGLDVPSREPLSTSASQPAFRLSGA